VRPDGESASDVAIQDAVIGCPHDTSEIGITARVPRGEIRFQDAFIHDVRRLMDRGSVRFGDAVAMLNEGSKDKAGIGRNLLFLVASGALAPFARVSAGMTTPPTKLATPVVERAVRNVAGSERPSGLVPSPTYGNGIEVDTADARAIIELFTTGGRADERLQRKLSTFARLGLVA
jgi:hypothetical protein